MTRVKICGITNRGDAEAAVALGADALGFIFVRNTPRFVGELPGLIELLESVPPFISRVGVCISPDDVCPDLRGHIDVLQIYDHSTYIRSSLAFRMIPAFRLRNASDLDLVEQVLSDREAPAVQLDAFHAQHLGGGGQTFDWAIAREAMVRFSAPIILAGGLTPENVAEAIRQVRPYAVDVSSGVEMKSSAPGHKDHDRIKAFISAVREAE